MHSNASSCNLLFDGPHICMLITVLPMCAGNLPDMQVPELQPATLMSKQVTAGPCTASLWMTAPLDSIVIRMAPIAQRPLTYGIEGSVGHPHRLLMMWSYRCCLQSMAGKPVPSQTRVLIASSCWSCCTLRAGSVRSAVGEEMHVSTDQS